MAKIYGQVEEVIAWLGNTLPNDEDGFMLLKWMESRVEPPTDGARLFPS
jgi:hypothetical protein